MPKPRPSREPSPPQRARPCFEVPAHFPRPEALYVTVPGRTRHRFAICPVTLASGIAAPGRSRVRARGQSHFETRPSPSRLPRDNRPELSHHTRPPRPSPWSAAVQRARVWVWCNARACGCGVATRVWVWCGDARVGVVWRREDLWRGVECGGAGVGLGTGAVRGCYVARRRGGGRRRGAAGRQRQRGGAANGVEVMWAELWCGAGMWALRRRAWRGWCGAVRGRG